jgi:hypothetical protein
MGRLMTCPCSRTWAGGWSALLSGRSEEASKQLVDSLFFLYLLREIWSSLKDLICKGF